MTVGEKSRLVVDMVICGKTYREIAEELGIPYTTCSRIVNNYRKFGDEIFDNKRTYGEWEPKSKSGTYRKMASIKDTEIPLFKKGRPNKEVKMGKISEPVTEEIPQGIITRQMIQKLYTELRPGQEVLVKPIIGRSRIVVVEMIYPHFLLGRGREVIRYDDVLRARCV